ncbi:MAG TPA: hypothetical protein VF865_08195 [Acidobacteriaceae bacterium]
MLTAVVPTQEETRPIDGRDLILWQRRLLPFMTYFIVVMAAAFFFFSALHVYQVTKFIQAEHGEDIRSLIESEVDRPAGRALTPEEVTEHSLLLLEADTLDKRYHQAGGLLMSRIWGRQLTFIAGMVLAFVGAVFILGKLSEGTSQVSGGAAEWKVAISSASPGIILSFFGTVLLISSLFVRASLDVSDGPAYINAVHVTSAAPTAAAAVPTAEKQVIPLDLSEIEKLEKHKVPK